MMHRVLAREVTHMPPFLVNTHMLIEITAGKPCCKLTEVKTLSLTPSGMLEGL